MSISLNLQQVKKIVLGSPRHMKSADMPDKPFTWQSVTFHMDNGESVTVDCCMWGTGPIPVECRKNYKLLDALNHHTAVLLREMQPQADSAKETEGAAVQGVG